MKSREGNHVHRQFPEVSIQLPWEAEAGGDARHRHADEVVEVSVCGVLEQQSLCADVVKGLVVDDVRGICIFDKLVYGQGSIVWFHHSV